MPERSGRARAPNSPVRGDGTDARTARPTKNPRPVLPERWVRRCEAGAPAACSALPPLRKEVARDES